MFNKCSVVTVNVLIGGGELYHVVGNQEFLLMISKAITGVLFVVVFLFSPIEKGME